MGRKNCFHRYKLHVTPCICRCRIDLCHVAPSFSCFEAVTENNRSRAPTLPRSAWILKQDGRYFCRDARELYCNIKIFSSLVNIFCMYIK